MAANEIDFSQDLRALYILCGVLLVSSLFCFQQRYKAIRELKLYRTGRGPQPDWSKHRSYGELKWNGNPTQLLITGCMALGLLLVLVIPNFHRYTRLSYTPEGFHLQYPWPLPDRRISIHQVELIDIHWSKRRRGGSPFMVIHLKDREELKSQDKQGHKLVSDCEILKDQFQQWQAVGLVKEEVYILIK